MDNVKKANQFQTERDENCVQDLKNHLIEIRKLQEDVVKSSLDILKKIDKISSNILLDKVHNDVSDGSKMQMLIQEFEATCKGTHNCKTSMENFNQDKFLKKSAKRLQQNVKVNKLRVSENIRDKMNKFSLDQTNLDIPITSKNINGTLNNALHTAKLSSEKNTEPDCCSYYVSCSSSIVSLQRFTALNTNSNYSISKCSNSIGEHNSDNDDDENDLEITR